MPKIATAVETAMAQRALRVDAKSDDVLRELLRLAMMDPGNAFDAKGRPLPLRKMSEDVRRSIKSLEVTEIFGGEERKQIGVITKLQFWDKGAALERLGKHLQLFDGKAGSKPLQTSAAKDLTIEQLQALADLEIN